MEVLGAMGHVRGTIKIYNGVIGACDEALGHSIGPWRQKRGHEGTPRGLLVGKGAME